MNGLGLSRDFFVEVAQPQLKRDFPMLYPRLAAGLVGNGSECFGFDDEISRDHDWGVDFFIWTVEDDRDAIPSLIEWKRELFDKNPPKYKRTRSEYGANITVMTAQDFYRSLIGLPNCPQTIAQWLKAPEENFALTVNGEVFCDGAGEFTKIRNAILEYYPEDIRRKKISARCMSLAQTGQYNFDRTAKRGDTVTLHILLSRFIESAVSMVFLLNRTFKPYYKWAFRAMLNLPILGAEIRLYLERLADYVTTQETRRECIFEICALFTEELRRQNLSQSGDWFLTTHGEEIRRAILDNSLRTLPAQYEV